MNVDLTREDLKSLVYGTGLNYNGFNDSLVVKAKHRFSESYSKSSWDGLDNLTDLELMKLFKICKDSWNK
jgi:hypothetical protein